jgi:hypothetical protein
MKLTKKCIEECRSIVKTHGYWSEETKNYLSVLPWHIAQRLHSQMIQFEKNGYKEVI